ncbi:MAG: hypothetical protein CL489_10005 [Acidobacteria bacterium]|nr:hypothetical protein [Acidobacteriota bacterium]
MVLLEQAERPLRRTPTRRITMLIRVMAIRLSKTITTPVVTRQNRIITGFKTITAHPRRQFKTITGFKTITAQIQRRERPARTRHRTLMRHRIIMTAHPVQILIRQ